MKNHCQIKKSKFSEEMELIINKATTFITSCRKFNVRCTTSNDVTLDSLSKLQDYQNVNVMVKVIANHIPIEIKTGLMKQDVMIADETGKARLTLWQDDINKLEVNKSYKFQMLTVRSFNALKYLSPPKHGWSFELCDDIDVGDQPNDDDTQEVIDASVDGVSYIGTKFSCLVCKSAVDVSSSSEKFGKCSNHNAQQYRG